MGAVTAHNSLKVSLSNLHYLKKLFLEKLASDDRVNIVFKSFPTPPKSERNPNHPPLHFQETASTIRRATRFSNSYGHVFGLHIAVKLKRRWNR